ncbi:protein maternal effect lethal 26-like [Chironomus tepperi]|uniref:protein maternal effect lethal 26-like n=1 Tax=Chironomus tepperi TaxID=113505 RepID=UPI00391F9BC3
MGSSLSCTFHLNDQDYSCHVEDQIIPENDDLNLSGKHVDKMKDKDVTTVLFNNCTITKIPKGLTKLYPKLESLVIHNSKITEITKDHLTEYKSLKKLDLSGQEIEFLPADLFEGFENLEHVDFSKNKLKLIEPKIFDGLNKLKFVNLEFNTHYFLLYSKDSDNPLNTNLQEFKKKLVIKYPSSLVMTNKEIEMRDLTDNPNDEDEQHIAVKISESVLIANLKAFYEHDKDFRDFTITIYDRFFRVHKSIIAARSPTLAEILRNNPDAENLNLVDIPVGIFEKILKFIYTAELPQDEGTNYLHLFAAAGKLKIEDLKNYAASKVKKEINTENALDIIKLSNKYEHYGLRQNVFDMLKKKYSEIKFKDEWANDVEKLREVMNFVKKKEEIILKLGTEFENLMS